MFDRPAVTNSRAQLNAAYVYVYYPCFFPFLKGTYFNFYLNWQIARLDICNIKTVKVTMLLVSQPEIFEAVS